MKNNKLDIKLLIVMKKGGGLILGIALAYGSIYEKNAFSQTIYGSECQYILPPPRFSTLAPNMEV